MSGHILTEVADGIARIQISRPEKMNALTLAMYAEIADELERAASAPDVRVVLIHGEPTVFSSGNDLADFMNPTWVGDDRPGLRFLRAISAAPQPVVAAVKVDAGHLAAGLFPARQPIGADRTALTLFGFARNKTGRVRRSASRSRPENPSQPKECTPTSRR
jgi:enoyl-CoA hydratase/isomerase-like protein